MRPRPNMIEWLLSGGTTVTSILNRSPDAPALKQRVEKVTVRDHIPYGATAWRLAMESVWRNLESLPPEWGLKRLSDAVNKYDYGKGYTPDPEEDEG